MKKNLFILVALSLVWMMQSCGTYTQFQTTQARMLDVEASSYVKPLVAELKVDTEKGRIKDEWLLTKEEVEVAIGRKISESEIEIAIEKKISNIYAYGLFKSSQKHEADVIVAPLFDLKTDDENHKYYKLTIIGYPAIFVNWDTLKESDYEWIKLKKNIQTYDINQIPVPVIIK